MPSQSLENPTEVDESLKKEIVIANDRVGQAPEADEPLVNEVDLTDTSRKLEKALDKSGVMEKELNGKTGEEIAKTVIKNEPDFLKNAEGEPAKIKGVADGQFDGVHGIDLVAADAEGRPIIIEVKEVQGNPAHLNEKSLTSLEKEYGEVKQMDDKWVKDRWLRLISNDDHVKALEKAGVDPRYLDKDELKEDPDLWKDIFRSKAVVVVSPEGKDAVTNHLHEQCSERNVSNICAIRTPADDIGKR
jgi:hypothetical protein